MSSSHLSRHHLWRMKLLTNITRLKLKRPQAARAYRNELDQLYAGALAGESKSPMKAKL